MHGRQNSYAFFFSKAIFRSLKDIDWSICYTNDSFVVLYSNIIPFLIRRIDYVFIKPEGKGGDGMLSLLLLLLY